MENWPDLRYNHCINHFGGGIMAMTPKELLERDKKMQPSLQYKLTHQGLLIYFGIVLVILVAFMVFMSIDDKKYLPVGIALLVLFALVSVGFLVAMVIVRKKVFESPEVKEGAKHPARILISGARYNQLRNRNFPTVLEKGRLDAYRFFLADQLMNGDLQPAVVVSESPFIIGVYSNEFDAAVLHSFPEALCSAYGLKAGDRLAATVCYFKRAFSHHGIGKDIFPGANQSRKWEDLLAVIPLFLAKDENQAKEKCAEINEETWAAAIDAIRQRAEDYPDLIRNGFWFVNPSLDDWDRMPISEAER